MEERNSADFSSFPALKDGKIDTELFLDAARSVVFMVDKFGKIFAPVKSDMNGNIGKINKLFQVDKVKYKTLHDMIAFEISEGDQNNVIISLLWLNRALHFMELFLEQLLQSSKEEQPCESLKNELTHAYTNSLKPYHGWINQKVFLFICRMCPSRMDFVKSLHSDEDTGEFYKKVTIFLETLHENRCEVHRLYDEKNLNNNDVV